MTKEEFGVDLYEAIKAQASRVQALRHGDQKEAASWHKELHALLPKLTNPDDVRRILAMQ